MSNYEILPVDPTVAFIVTIDDQPVQNADGRTLLFYREVDAQRCIDRMWERKAT